MPHIVVALKVAASFSFVFNKLARSELEINSAHVRATIWHAIRTPLNSIYLLLIDGVWQSLVAVSTPAPTGCTITFVTIDAIGRRKTEMIAFRFLFPLFVIIRSVFNYLYKICDSASIIMLHILCEILLNFDTQCPPLSFRVKHQLIRTKSEHHHIYTRFRSIPPHLYLSRISTACQPIAPEVLLSCPPQWHISSFWQIRIRNDHNRDENPIDQVPQFASPKIRTT